MATPDVLTRESLQRFLAEYGDNQVKRELLLFWGLHPNAKFNRFAICYAVDSRQFYAKIALKDMVEAGLVDVYVNNGETLYSLTQNELRRRPVLELAALGWDQWQLMLRQLDGSATGSRV
jgi:hypothetical protein